MIQMVLAVVQDEDVGPLCDQLTSRGFRATRISTLGSFLARGNATVLIGVDEQRVEDVIAILGSVCRTRRSYINAVPWATGAGDPALLHPTPLEVEVGGANIFIFPVRRFRDRLNERDGEMGFAKPPRW